LRPEGAAQLSGPWRQHWGIGFCIGTPSRKFVACSETALANTKSRFLRLLLAILSNCLCSDSAIRITGYLRTFSFLI